MIKVNIKKDNVVTNSATFETQSLVDAWLAQEQAINSFGKNERWVRDSLFSPLTQEEKDSALDQREIEILEETAQEYLLPAEYEVEVIDVTEELSNEKAKAEALAYLNDTDWYVVRFMDNGSDIPQDIKDKRQLARQTLNQ